MNSSHLRNKVGLAVYSTLISIMSGMSHLKDGDQQGPYPPDQTADFMTVENIPLVSPPPQRTLAMRWSRVQQALLSLLLWIVLGFAAGFLIGMLQTG